MLKRSASSLVNSDTGSGLIWFIFLIGILLSVIMVLVSATHQYLYSRVLTDYLEQYAIAGKTLIDSGDNLANANDRLQQYFGTAEFRITSFRRLDSKTLEVIGCGEWRSPIDLVQANRSVCQRALAR